MVSTRELFANRELFTEHCLVSRAEIKKNAFVFVFSQIFGSPRKTETQKISWKKVKNFQQFIIKSRKSPVWN